MHEIIFCWDEALQIQIKAEDRPQMARPIWKGNISFGLVNIPISLHSAVKKNEMHFELLDRRTKSQVRYERVNEQTGQQVPWDQIVKGYKYSGGDYIVLDEEDFKKAAVEATQTIEILDFVPLDRIEFRYFEKPYFVVPEKKAEKGYALLREVLKRTGKVAISKVVIRSRQYLTALVPQGEALVLNTLRYHDELRNPSEFKFPSEDIEQYKVTERELQIAQMLVESMASQWDPARYHDDYREALMEWIEKKAQAGGAILPPQGEVEGKEEAGKVVDMMELLKRSVQRVAERRGNEEAPRKAEDAA
jgi:DNA end-binding protein Ku